jgi:hypothetical protein
VTPIAVNESAPWLRNWNRAHDFFGVPGHAYLATGVAGCEHTAALAALTGAPVGGPVHLPAWWASNSHNRWTTIRGPGQRRTVRARKRFAALARDEGLPPTTWAASLGRRAPDCRAGRS